MLKKLCSVTSEKSLGIRKINLVSAWTIKPESGNQGQFPETACPEG